MRRALSAVAAFALVLGLAFTLAPHASQAANPNVGYADFAFGSAPGTDPTADKPQSKLWHNDGYWWSVMFNSGSGKWHIYRLNWPSQWVDTGVVVDERPTSRADALSVGSKLYVASLVRLSSSNQGRLYRYSYNSNSDSYSLDSGFPAQIMSGSAETMAFDQDSTGRLWITYTQNKQVYVNHSTTADNVWTTPFVVPGAAGIGSDDISSLVAYDDKNGPSIGVLWSSHSSAASAASMNFASHKDSDQPGTWQPIETIYGGTGSCLADDHINLKSLQADESGRIFAALKTSLGDSGCPSGNEAIRLVVRNPNNTWKWTTFGVTSDGHTRPVVLLDTTNRKVYMFATAPTSCGIIYYKVTPMDNPSFGSGKGTPFISSSTNTCINNATTTKQTVNASTGLVVMASDESSKVYLHNAIALDGSANPTATSTATATSIPGTPTATSTPGATSTPTATGTPPPAGSASIKNATFENGSLTNATTGVDTVVNTVALETAAPLNGSYSARIDSTNGYLREDFTGVNELFASFYVKLSAKPTTTARLALISNGSTSVGTLNLTTSGALQLRNGSTNIGSVSPALAIGTVYRVGLRQKAGSGNAVLEAYLAQADTPFGTPFATSSTQSFTSQATRFSLGATNSNAVNLTVDDIRLDTSGFASGDTPASTNTPTATGTPVATNTPTSTPMATNTPTSTPTADPAASPTSTSTPTSTPTATSTPSSTGSRIKDMTFESGLTGADGADSASGTTLTRITAGPLKGSASAQVANSSSASAYLQEDFTAVDNLYLSFYLKVNTLPTSDLRIALVSNSGTTVGELLLRTNGALRLRNAGTTVGTDSAALAAGTVYRIGLVQKKGTGGNAVLQAFIATGDASFATPFAQTTTGSWTSQANRLRLGATVSGVVNLVVDDVRLDAAAMP
jgi:hypothetical protein